MEGVVKSGRPGWLAGLVCAVVALALGCARQTWTRDNVMTWEGCCEGTDACLALLQETHGPDTGEKWPAPEQACAAWKLGRAGVEGVPRLVSLLEHPERRVRGGAVQALANMGENAKSALPALLDAYEREPRGMALHALSSLDDERAAPAILRHLLESPTSTLEHLGPTLAPVLVGVLENPESSWEALVLVRHVLTRRGSMYTETFVPRLRTLLARELAEPTLRRPPGMSCPAAPAPGCEAVFDGCTPRAAYVASVLAAYGRQGEKAAPEVLQALQRGDVRLTPVALQALVAFGSPAAVPGVLEQLAAPECRARALTSLASLGPVARPAATEPLLRLLATGGEGWERARAAEALGRVGDSAALDALRQAVDAPHSEVQAAAVDALGSYSFQAHAEELKPLLQQVVAAHASPVARIHARLALEWRSDQEVRPADSIDCARLIPGRSGEWTVCEDGHTSVQLHWDKPKAPPQGSPCAAVPGGDSASVLEAMGEACLVGWDDGEFGGALGVYEAGRMTVLEEPQANPLQVVRMHGTLVVLEGLAHLLGGAGRLVRVDASEGRWRATPWVTLPGAPMAYALDDAGDLVVGTTDQRLDAVVCGPAGALAPAHVVRITRDGRLAPVGPKGQP
ncbi:HEAT repeat domain-containing protein [Myxococcus xanthus]|uniref:HEAT repeat domain-containing protein n=1 Tax=Myxococcus xanthus TaxID=34 RepID=A0A7Y4IKR1_MYXXA|nr:HEAT repeat domain-containing protein [Myxococcus xanthus]NOJ80380.1 HEAT repeat domain-containing protein [Myxococcus xanthus]NOJ84913.1 HEAT repeat domain-containing protein [Myxococcus xanthus]